MPAKGPVAPGQELQQSGAADEVADQVRAGVLGVGVPDAVLGAVVQRPDFTGAHLVARARAQHEYPLAGRDGHVDPDGLGEVGRPVDMRRDGASGRQARQQAALGRGAEHPEHFPDVGQVSDWPAGPRWASHPRPAHSPAGTRPRRTGARPPGRRWCPRRRDQGHSISAASRTASTTTGSRRQPPRRRLLSRTGWSGRSSKTVTFPDLCTRRSISPGSCRTRAAHAGALYCRLVSAFSLVLRG